MAASEMLVAVHTCHFFSRGRRVARLQCFVTFKQSEKCSQLECGISNEWTRRLVRHPQVLQMWQSGKDLQKGRLERIETVSSRSHDGSRLVCQHGLIAACEPINAFDGCAREEVDEAVFRNVRKVGGHHVETAHVLCVHLWRVFALSLSLSLSAIR